MLLVAHLPDRGAAVDVDLADLARTQAYLRVVALTGQQLHRGAGRARQLGALAGQHLDAMDRGSDRDVLERQGIADLDRRFRPRHELRAGRYPLGGDDVAPLAVGVAQQREQRAAVRVVFEPLDLRPDGVLVALEVDFPVELLVAAALVAHGDLAVHVAAALLGLVLDEMRDGPALVQARCDHLHVLTLARRDGPDLDQHYLASACSAKLISWPALRQT